MYLRTIDNLTVDIVQNNLTLAQLEGFITDDTIKYFVDSLERTKTEINFSYGNTTEISNQYDIFTKINLEV